MLGGEGRKPGAGAKGEGSESRGRGGPPDQEIPGEPSLSRALGPAWPLIPPLTSFGAPPWIAGGSWGVFSSPVRLGGGSACGQENRFSVFLFQLPRSGGPQASQTELRVCFITESFPRVIILSTRPLVHSDCV